MNIGNALKDWGKLDDAVAAFGRAIEINPALAEAHLNFGAVLHDLRRFDEAIIAYRNALRVAPGYADAHYNLGNALKEQGNSDRAIDAYRQAILHNPAHAGALANMGNILKDQARLDEAMACYDKAIALEPDNQLFQSNRLYTLFFHPGFDATIIAEAHRAWNEQFVRPLSESIEPYLNTPDPDRRLRVGYISPDFREQAESYFTIPLLENHDHARVEIFCYSTTLKRDDFTQRISTYRRMFWRDVRTETDESLARIIRDDRIDILVDLTMHMANNRALLFARKPAPVQVCWLAYPGTSGLGTMDYRITDSIMDPADADVLSVYADDSRFGCRIAGSYMIR